jgi:adenylate kinase family enzyme
LEKNTLRINVIGTTGSGKTTFAKKLAETLSIPFIELDALFWEPNWQMPEDGELFNRLESALEGSHWVLDGNYTRTLPIKWERVNTVIWLDFSFLRTFYQSISRAISRLFSKQELWPGTGNRETLIKLFSKESIVLWMVRTHGRNRKKITGFMNSPEYTQINFIQIRSPKHASDFLDRVAKDQNLPKTSEE